MAGYWIFKKMLKLEISSHWLTHYLTTVKSLEPKQSSEQLPFYTTTTKSPMRCAFWGSDKCGASVPQLFLVSSIRLFFFFMQRNHINGLIFSSTLSLSSVSRCHSINFKVLALLRLEVQLDKYRYDNASARYKQKAGCESMLVAVILSLSLQPNFSGFKMN